MTKKKRETGNMLGVKLSGTSKASLLQEIENKLSLRPKIFITTPNPEIVLRAQSSSKLRKAINASTYQVIDGVGLLWAIKMLNIKGEYELIKGRLLFLDLLRLANKKKLAVFFLGSTKEVNTKAILRVRKEFPNIKISGSSGPQLDNEANNVSKDNIKLKRDIDILFVAFGAPKQEIWIHKNINKLPVKLAMGIGGTLDYYSGVKSLPPKWIDKLNLEWLWRMVREPGHVKRVFRAVVVFPLVVLKHRLVV